MKKLLAILLTLIMALSAIPVMAEETSATSEELAAQAVTLNELVQMFELK